MKYEIIGKFWNAFSSERVVLNTISNKDYAIRIVSILQNQEEHSYLHKFGCRAEYWYETKPGD